MLRKIIFPTIFTLVAFAFLIMLGTWQMQRLAYKKSTIESINEQIKLPALSVDAVGQIIDVNDFKYRKVKLVGEFLHDKEIHLFTGPKVMKGDPGYNILTPLKLDNGNVVLVDRGWVKSDNKKTETRPESLTKGKVEIIGMIHNGETPGYFTPDNNVAQNLWFWIDIPTIATSTGINLQNLYVRALKNENSDQKSPFIAGEAKVELRNDHLQYAITWYSLAIILLIIYLIYIKKEFKRQNGTL